MTCINWKNFLNEGDKGTITHKQSWETEVKAESLELKQADQVTEEKTAFLTEEKLLSSYVSLWSR